MLNTIEFKIDFQKFFTSLLYIRCSSVLFRNTRFSFILLMISIIIPTYNYVCTKLVSDLAQQAERMKAQYQDGFDYEILVADDGSDNPETIRKNGSIRSLSNCQFIERKTNVGRAYLRNWLIDQSKYPFLLLVDSDAQVCTADFLEKYWQARNQADLICGSIRNPDTPCPEGCELRYRYEHRAEKQRKKAGRNLNPYVRLSTFNLFINKKRLGSLRFDTRCKEYGYEDALLGLTLKDKGFTVIHLDNPLIHNGIDTNVSFLEKTEAAMRTLSRLKGAMQENAGTSRAYALLTKYHLQSIFRLFFQGVRKPIRKNLTGHHPSLFLFQLYKLGYYSDICKSL